MKNPLCWKDASKAEWKEACRRETVIRPLVSAFAAISSCSGFTAGFSRCFRGLPGRLLGEGSVAYFALYDWFDVDDRGTVDGFE
jgi:hypothetical protein